MTTKKESRSIRLNSETLVTIKEVAKFYKRDMINQLDWWLNIGIIVERDYPELMPEILKKINEK